MSEEQRAAHQRLLQVLPVRTHQWKVPQLTAGQPLRGDAITIERRNRVRGWLAKPKETRPTRKQMAKLLGISKSAVNSHVVAIRAETE